MTSENAVHHYVEALPNGRGQLRCDVVIDGSLAFSEDVGSPAPLSVVELFARTINLAPTRPFA